MFIYLEQIRGVGRTTEELRQTYVLLEGAWWLLRVGTVLGTAERIAYAVGVTTGVLSAEAEPLSC